MGKVKKKLIFLIFTLVLIFSASFVARNFNTSYGKVKVERISFETDMGKLSGLLYMPNTASSENPQPTIVTTHGYLNSAEMQDAPAIEMSRRGYVVLALDQYDHGHSRGNKDNTGSFFNFWPTSIWDAVNYMYDQDYVLKDKNKNGIIAVSGHSMGGFSSSMAVYYDEESYKDIGYRKIHAQLSAGSDYLHTTNYGYQTEDLIKAMSSRYIGKIAGQFDEFFFNGDAQVGTVVKKDYVKTPEAQMLLEKENPKVAKWYKSKSGGQRIVYQPYQTHPWNHFSKETTKNMIDFYDKAFAAYKTKDINDINSDDQIWMYKEAAEGVALIGFLIFIPLLASIILNLGFFKSIKTIEEITPIKLNNSLESSFVNKLVFVVGLLFPAVIFSPVYAGNFYSDGMKTLNYMAVIIFVFSFIAIGLSLKYKENKYWKTNSIVLILVSIVLFILTKFDVFKTSPIFQAPTVNRIVVWALICSAISITMMIYNYLLSRNYEKGIGLLHFGLKANIGQIILSLLVAILVGLSSFTILFLVDLLFTTDFRIWTLAFKTFDLPHLISALKYMPLFFIYYLVAGASSIYNSYNKRGIVAYFYSCIINMGGILLWIILQYGLLFIKGVSFYPNDALSGILLIALIPTLIVVFVNTRYLYKESGNIYTAAFINAIVLTMMTVANTAVYFQI